MKNELIIKKVRPEKLQKEVAFIFDRLQVGERVAREGTVLIKPNIFCEEGFPVAPNSLGIELSLPPLLFSRFFCRSNQIFFTLAPTIERFFDPKIILNLMVNKHFIKFMRHVQKILKI